MRDVRHMYVTNLPVGGRVGNHRASVARRFFLLPGKINPCKISSSDAADRNVLAVAVQ